MLVELIDTAPPIGDTVYAWRGIRSCRNTFGVDDLDLAVLAGGPRIRVDRFTSFSTSRDVAVREFTRPRGPGGPALWFARIAPGRQYCGCQPLATQPTSTSRRSSVGPGSLWMS